MTKVEFIVLTEKWKQETAILSSLTQIFRHPSVEKLVQAGDAILPWIFEAYEGDLWIAWGGLLQKITGKTPFGRKDRGHVRKIQESWLVWWSNNKETFE